MFDLLVYRFSWASFAWVSRDFFLVKIPVLNLDRLSLSSPYLMSSPSMKRFCLATLDVFLGAIVMVRPPRWFVFLLLYHTPRVLFKRRIEVRFLSAFEVRFF